MLHEENLAANASANITVRIPHSQTLDTTSLEHDLPELAEGRPASAMVLALRSVLKVAHGWENQAVARGVVDLLARTDFPSRDWTLGHVIDELVRRSEEHTSELQSLMRISSAVFCLTTKNRPTIHMS